MNDSNEFKTQSMNFKEFISDIQREVALADEYIENDPRMSFRKSVEILLHILRKIFQYETNTKIPEVPQTKKPGLEIIYLKVKNHIDKNIGPLIPFILMHNKSLFFDSTYDISSDVAKTASDSIKQIIIYFGKKYAKSEHEIEVVKQLKENWFTATIKPVPKLNYKKYLIWSAVLLLCLFIGIWYYIQKYVTDKPISDKPPTTDYLANKNCTEIIKEINKLKSKGNKELFWINFCLIQIGKPDYETIKKMRKFLKKNKSLNPDYEKYLILYDLLLIISIYQNDVQKAQNYYDQFKANCRKNNSFCRSQLLDHFEQKSIEELSEYFLEFTPQSNDPFQFFELINK